MHLLLAEVKNVKNTDTMQETNKPSIPSIKLQKLIIPVDNISTIKSSKTYPEPEK